MSFEIFDRVFCGFFYESGTYCATSGTTLQRFGFVQNHDVTHTVGVIPIRYAGGGTRDVSVHTQGPIDVEGTLTFFPQDFKSLFLALGSVADAGSPSPYSHTIVGVNSDSLGAYTSGTNNPMVSFTVQDTHETTTAGLHFKRTMSGCIVNSLTISATEREIVNCELNYVGQSIVFSSGAATALEARSTAGYIRPYLWQDVTVHIPSGTIIEPVKDFSLSINNNLAKHHYLNGSRVISSPVPTVRDYEVALTVNANSTSTKTFFESYFIGAGLADGSEFNMMVSMNASTGSRDAYIVLSGCKLTDFTAPSNLTNEIQEQTLTIQPKTVTAVVNDELINYGAF